MATSQQCKNVFNTVKENQYLLKYFLEPWRIKYLNIDSFFKKLYTDKFDGIVDIQNNAYHRAIKVKLIDVKASTYNDVDIKDLKFKVAEYQNIKTFFQKTTNQIGQKIYFYWKS